MKIKIGPYRSDLLPVKSWERMYENFRSGSYYHPEREWKWFDRIIYRTFDKLDNFFLPINRWYNNRERKITVHIDNYDVWGAHTTLSLIIHPVLVKLKEVQHGYPYVDDSDVSEELRITESDRIEAETNSRALDNKHEARWNYILNEMIWAFEQCKYDDNNTDQFHHNADQLELITTPLEDKPGYSSIDFITQKDPLKPEYWVDYKAKELHNDRISNGLRLFAKYYFNLWD